jgi:pimeloyl-ACP methyl ester carboxylesterase
MSSKPVRHTIGWWAGMCLSALLATAGTVALRHALQTPQPLKSLLPGEALLYRWQRRCIFYKVFGSAQAPPLVLLHTPALGASAHQMRHLIVPLARTYRVYAPDLPGFGLSDRPAWPYSAALYSSLCQDFLRDVVQAPATLLASELSCNYAVSAAASSPGLCMALILISPYALQGNSRSTLPGTIAAVPLLKTLLYPLLCTRLGFLLTHTRQQRERSDFARFYAQTHQLGAEHAAMALLAGKLVENVSQQFQNLGQPVLSIWGAQSEALPATAAQQPRRTELILEAGLAAHEEQPESVIAAIRRWQTESMPIGEQVATHLDTTTAPPQARQDSVPAPAADQALPSPPAENGAQTERHTAPPTEEKSESQSRSNVAYCVKCKQKREIQSAHEVTMKNGRRAVRGTCVVCGATLNRIGNLA